EPEGFIYAVAMLEPRADFWDIEFPAMHQAEEALARLLMECSFCQRREVVYLNEMELKSFEIRKCVARVCRHCDAPSIWVEAATEPKIDETLPSRTAVEERVIPRRNRTRVKARVLACVRRRGFQEEVAVCEDLSKGGISFRSRNRYPEGTRLEVAVPYTPGAGAIFVPIRIVFSQPIATAGLFRHGAAFVRPPDWGDRYYCGVGVVNRPSTNFPGSRVTWVLGLKSVSAESSRVYVAGAPGRVRLIWLLIRVDQLNT